jgi:leucyl-tRNA synthetase
MLNLLPLTTNSIDVAISAPIDAVSAVVKTAEIAADSTGKIISAATGQAVPIIATASMLVQKGPEAINKAVNVAATVEKDLNKYTKPSVIQDLAVKQGVMTGGGSNNSPLLEGALILIISLILGGGIYQGGLRIKELIKQNNGGAKRDDRPVEPRGF